MAPTRTAPVPNCIQRKVIIAPLTTQAYPRLTNCSKLPLEDQKESRGRLEAAALFLELTPDPSQTTHLIYKGDAEHVKSGMAGGQEQTLLGPGNKKSFLLVPGHKTQKIIRRIREKMQWKFRR